jgi:hypothetical protein
MSDAPGESSDEANKYERLARASIWKRLEVLTMSSRFLAFIALLMVGSQSISQYFTKHPNPDPPKLIEVDSARFYEALKTLEAAKFTTAELSKVAGSGAATPEMLSLVERTSTDIENAYAALSKLPLKDTEGSLFPALISTAYAQDADKPTGGPLSSFKQNLIIYIIGIMSALLFAMFLMYLLTKNPDRMKTADKHMNTIMGFLIGLATGIMGGPAA